MPCDRTGTPPYTDCCSIQILCEEVDSLCDRFTAHVALFERLCARLARHVTAQESHRARTLHADIAIHTVLHILNFTL